MLSFLISRTSFVLLSAVAGGLVLKPGLGEGMSGQFLGWFAGGIFGFLAVAMERILNRLPSLSLLAGGVGGIAGLGAAGLFLTVAGPLFEGLLTADIWRLGALLVFGYIGCVIGSRWGAESVVGMLATRQARSERGDRRGDTNIAQKILDTSVIIDGRIADLCDTGFMEGVFLLPQFILQELQHIADSSDSLKRARGRRGLDVLRRVQEMPSVIVTIIDDDFSNIREVDAKLVALAKKLDAKIVTNDLNLNKVASLQGVKVLNINDLSNALRPVVLPGEALHVFVLKEGKEAGQGVAYLEDGTMVVIDDAKRMLNKYVNVTVTSVLQTTAGRMIFSKLREETGE